MTWNSVAMQLEWTWIYDNPVQWKIESSADGVSGWSVLGFTDGADRVCGCYLGLYYRLTGVDSLYAAVTGISAAVLAA